MGIAGTVGSEVAKRVAPSVTGRTVRVLLERAIDGVPGIPGAAKSADAKLKAAGGEAGKAIESLTTMHVRLAAAEGFLTNVGGLVSVAIGIPANIAGIALLQCHLAAGILHLRGYALDQPGTRDAALLCLLSDDNLKALSKKLKRPVDAVTLASVGTDPVLGEAISRAVTAELIAAAGGKRLASFVARRIPLLGGAVGGIGDAWSTRRIGKTAARIPPNGSTARSRLAKD
ncbi:hypothetical protein GIS00_14950 [Nakamurella sp. YIM 132087]|uniref:EcsC family protein n=1 Tax=Nakamurella alba TaxID=2665158 RepID=A0A7K1FM96_9ACTN|nr:hypothetical protein [Nakamurella alba]MTD15238.1 hypothetical protein [Nakamurella alba]